MINTSELNEVAESLPSDLKIQLIDRLLKSLSLSEIESLSLSEIEIDKAWAIEAETRVEELRKGYVKAIDGENVFRDIQERLTK